MYFGDITRAFPFILPTRIEFALGAATRVADEAAALGTRALVVTDPGVESAGLVESARDTLAAGGLDPSVYSQVEANPRVGTVHEVAAAAVDSGADVIVAIGGGSALDVAKAAAAVCMHGGGILDYEGLDKVPGPTVPVIAVPTTAGTGSEVTLWAIVTDPAREFKAPIGSVHLAPRVALVDPLMTVSLPPSMTAGTGMDALTHAVEAYTARCSNPISDALVLYAIRLIAGSIERAVADGDDLEARSAMLLGSLLAGIGFGNADTAAVHSMAEAIGAVKDVPHGIANAIFLPFVTRLNAEAETLKTAEIGAAMGLPVSDLTATEAALATVEALFSLRRRLGIPTLAETGVGAADIPKLALTAMMNSGNPDNPVEVTDEVFRRLFNEALAEA